MTTGAAPVSCRGAPRGLLVHSGRYVTVHAMWEDWLAALSFSAQETVERQRGVGRRCDQPREIVLVAATLHALDDALPIAALRPLAG